MKSRWNQDNRFAGWTDGALAKNSDEEAKKIAEKLFNFKIDKIYSSPLFRNQDTIAKILENVDDKYPIFIHLDKGKMKDWGNFEKKETENYLTVYVSENLNERYYGNLQGLDKSETIEKYGEEKVRLWRRSYNIAPPGGESLKNVFKRTSPFYKKYIESDLKKGENILIVASHNSLRAIAKYLENISDKDIVNFEIPFAGLVEYDLDHNLKVANRIIHNNP